MMQRQEQIQQQLDAVGYVAAPQLAMAIAMMDQLQRPLLLEGDAGVGKTQVAKSLSEATGRRLIRLQCYEGLDSSNAIYEWNYQRQILAIKLLESADMDMADKESHIFDDEFLLKRPLLEAIMLDEPPILLIDEIDRADEEFEAFLLEILSDFQITIPELRTIKAKSIPSVILTSNGTRELSDALRRRCLYHHLDYPGESTEIRIVLAHYPDIEIALASQIVRFVQAVRREDLQKNPGVAETLDWAGALIGLDIKDINHDLELLHQTLMCLLKTRADHEAMAPEIIERIVGKVA